MSQLTSEVTCRQKHKYHSLATAKRAKKRRNKASGYNYLRHYQCNVCNYWHLTTEVVASGVPEEVHPTKQEDNGGSNGKT